MTGLLSGHGRPQRLRAALLNQHSEARRGSREQPLRGAVVAKEQTRPGAGLAFPFYPVIQTLSLSGGEDTGYFLFLILAKGRCENHTLLG